MKGIFELIENGLPIDTIYADMISEPENIKPIEIDEELLQKSAETYWEMLTQAGLEDKTIAKRMLQNEPFSKYVEFCENFIKHKQGIV